MGAGYIYYFFSLKPWQIKLINHICNQYVAYDLIKDDIEVYQIDTFYNENDSKTCTYVYWDTENYPLVNNNNINCLNVEEIELLNIDYFKIFKSELNKTLPLIWIFEYLNYYSSINKQLWT